MGRFIRRLLMGAAAVWGVKSLQEKRREWSTRSSADIRNEVLSKLPASMDSSSKEKVADKVVQAVKGGDTRETGVPTTPPAGTTTPPPETPLATPGTATPPPPPPPSDPASTQGMTTPVPPVPANPEESDKSPITPPPASKPNDNRA